MPGCFVINLDVSELLGLDKRLNSSINQALKDATRDLSAMAWAHLNELVQEKLRSTRETYLNAISMEEVDGGEVWLINLDMKKAGWIEEGKQPGSMIDDLLKSKSPGWVKTAKDGSKYASVPFQHNKGAASQTPEATDLSSAIKKELSKRKIPYSKIETDEKGNPKTGRLHRLNVPTPAKTKNGSGQGWGPVGAPRQGATGIPFLRNVEIHQKDVMTPKGKKTVRGIFTYRTVSSKQTGEWFHPGLSPRKFFDETHDWIKDQWETQIKPKIIQSIMDGL